MKKAEIEPIFPFLAVVEHGSFRAAAKAIGVTPSAVSQSVKALEHSLKVPLLNRTTRSVGLTEAGQILSARCKPAFDEILNAVQSVKAFSDAPSGKLRINAPRIAQSIIFEPIIAEFIEKYPLIELEVFYDDGLTDIVSNGFDAGIRLGQMVDVDMTSTAITHPSKMAIVGSPEYFEKYGIPATPEELTQHRCLNYRRPTQKTLYHWRFIKDKQTIHLPVSGPVTFNDSRAKISASKQHLGLCYEVKSVVQEDIDNGQLVSVLDDYLPDIPGFHIYFTSRSQMMLKLRAFIDFAKEKLT